ncbi:hypothetical protein EJ08DRAFT_680693 [Tothia fuscella]|uniref:Uncharacterized protein n=1 Tax=Tothia fuscella TaxID=1048955 RepID=A0A9P4NMC0_9PEZI|nr:hypothetical protein EJ08DRAFT_680693 [Tothia fuscella]
MPAQRSLTLWPQCDERPACKLSQAQSSRTAKPPSKLCNTTLEASIPSHCRFPTTIRIPPDAPTAHSVLRKLPQVPGHRLGTCDTCNQSIIPRPDHTPSTTQATCRECIILKEPTWGKRRKFCLCWFLLLLPDDTPTMRQELYCLYCVARLLPGMMIDRSVTTSYYCTHCRCGMDEAEVAGLPMQMILCQACVEERRESLLALRVQNVTLKTCWKCRFAINPAIISRTTTRPEEDDGGLCVICIDDHKHEKEREARDEACRKDIMVAKLDAPRLSATLRIVGGFEYICRICKNAQRDGSFRPDAICDSCIIRLWPRTDFVDINIQLYYCTRCRGDMFSPSGPQRSPVHSLGYAFSDGETYERGNVEKIKHADDGECEDSFQMKENVEQSHTDPVNLKLSLMHRRNGPLVILWQKLRQVITSRPHRLSPGGIRISSTDRTSPQLPVAISDSLTPMAARRMTAPLPYYYTTMHEIARAISATVFTDAFHFPCPPRHSIEQKVASMAAYTAVVTEGLFGWANSYRTLGARDFVGEKLEYRSTT